MRAQLLCKSSTHAEVARSGVETIRRANSRFQNPRKNPVKRSTRFEIRQNPLGPVINSTSFLSDFFAEYGSSVPVFSTICARPRPFHAEHTRTWNQKILCLASVFAWIQRAHQSLDPDNHSAY